MKVDEIYLTESAADRLFSKLEQYNKVHPDDQITAQQLAEQLLNYGIQWLDISVLD